MRLRSILVLLAVFVLLGGYFYFSRMPKPAVPQPPKVPVWSVNQEALQRIEVQLPRESLSQAFVKDGESWYFDDTKRSAIEKNRWGGMPLLFSSPQPERLVAENATLAKLTEYGLTQPTMEVTLTLDNGQNLKVKIGDRTPDGHAFYAQIPGSNNVAVVDISWYRVAERLVKEPPYASS